MKNLFKKLETNAMVVMLVIGIAAITFASSLDLGLSPNLIQNEQKFQWVDLTPKVHVNYSTARFGNVTTGKFAVRTITFTNYSGNDIAEGFTRSVTGGGSSVFSHYSCAFSNISAGKSRTCGVRFSPLTLGNYSAVSHHSWPNKSDIMARLYGSGIVGTGAYSTYWSNNFTCSNGAYSTIIANCTTANAFNTVVGTTENTIVSGAYVITKSATSTTDQLFTSTLTNHNDTQLSFDVTLANVTGIGNGTPVFEIRTSTASQFDITLVASSGNYTSWRIAYRNGSNSNTNVTGSAYTFTAGHKYSIRFISKCSVTTSSSDGNFTLYISDNGAAETSQVAVTNINTFNANISRLYAGVEPGASLTNMFTYDNIVMGYK